MRIKQIFILIVVLLLSNTVNAKNYEYEIKKVDYKNLVAMLYLPKKEGTVSAVIVVGGSSGGMRPDKGELLASHGIAVLTLAYFREKELHSTLDSIPIEYVFNAIDFLETVPSIDSLRIGMLGSSRGSELAFLVASNTTKIKSLVAIAPSKVAWHGMTTQFAWSFRGHGVLSLTFDRDNKIPIIERSKKALRSMKNVKLAQFSFEKIGGPILLISAIKDRVWPSYQMAKDIEIYLKRHKFKYAVTHNSYPTGHTFNKNEAPKISQSIVDHFVSTL